jgi:hypothetical protein
VGSPATWEWRAGGPQRLARLGGDRFSKGFSSAFKMRDGVAPAEVITEAYLVRPTPCRIDSSASPIEGTGPHAAPQADGGLSSHPSDHYSHSHGDNWSQSVDCLRLAPLLSHSSGFAGCST